MILYYLLFALAAFLITYATVPLVKKVAFRIGALDYPDKRRINKKAMPNIGGLAIFFGFVTVTLVSLELSKEVLGIVLGGTLLLVMGFIDSLIDLKALPKLVIQIIGAFILIAFGVRIEFLSNPVDGIFVLNHYLSIFITVFWVVGITNAVNIIDGMDGLAGGVVMISSAVLAAVSYLTGRVEILPLALYLGATCLAFLRYNFYPAQIFMGDSGSQFLGFTLAGLSMLGTLKSATLISVLIPVLAMGVPVFDTAFVMIRRFVNKKPIHVADRNHLHHFFLDLGYDQKKAVLIMYGLNLVLGVIAIVSTQVSREKTLALFGMAVLFMILVRSGKFNSKGE